MSSMVANMLAMLAAKLLPPGFAFVVHVAVARLAGPESLGAYVNLLAVLMIFQAMAGAGMQFLVSREIAAAPERAAEHIRHARAFGLVTGVLGTAAYLAYAVTVLPSHRLAPALWLSLTVLPSAWIALQDAVFIATRTHHWIAVVAIVENSLKLGIALAALAAGYGLLEVCAGIAIARLAGLGTGAWLVRRVGGPGSWRVDLASVPAFARAIAPFSVLFVLSMVYFRIDVPIVEAIAGEHDTGLYGAATALYGALLLLPESALAAAYPRLARANQESREGYARATWILAKVLGLALVPISLTLVCLADPLLALLYGGEFAASGAVLRLLALALPLHAVNGALGQALQAGGEQRAMVGIIIFGVAVHVVLTATLVGTLGISGAAIAMILSSACVTCGALHAVHTRVSPVGFGWRLWVGTASAAGALLVAVLVPGAWRPVAAAAGCAWLVLASFRFGVLGPADLAGVRTALLPRAAGVAA